MLANRVRMSNALPTTIIGTWSLNEYLNVDDIIELKTTSSQFFINWDIINSAHHNGTELRVTFNNAIQIIDGRIYNITDNAGRFLYEQYRIWKIKSEATNSAHSEALLKFLIRNAKHIK